MKLASVRLHPFAGIRDRTYDFNNGLNVILGPNEAGKSTVFQAILNALLTTTSLTAAKLESEMGWYFPATGGDVIRVEIVLKDNEGKSIRIQKTWKKGNRQGSASMHMPDGTEITDEDEVQRQIESLLPVSPATMRTILLADQSGLYRTIQEMKQEDSVRRELGDLLRRNLMETGGMSVDRFRELLDQKYDDYFKRWDRDQQYPENNRGIKNPYKSGLGKILEAFYEKERLRLDLEKTQQFDLKLDAINESLTTLTADKKEKQQEFDRLNPLKEGIRQKQLKEQQLVATKEKRERLLDISKKWPVFEDRIAHLEPQKKKQEEAITRLQKELKEAQDQQKVSVLKEKLEKLNKLSGKVSDAQKELDEAHKIEETDLQQLRSLQSEITRLKTQIEAAKLTVKITSESDRQVDYEEAGKKNESVNLQAGQTTEKTASGGFNLQSDGLEVQVFSGEGDLESIIKESKRKDEELERELKKLTIKNVQEAESFAALYRQKKQTLHQAQSIYESELGDQKIEELKKELESYGNPDNVRAISEINEDLISARTELNRLSEQASDAEKQLNEWKKQYESVDDVLLELADLTRAIKDLQKALSELPELPEGFETPEEFIQYVDTLDQDIRALDGKISEVKLEKTGLEANAPDISSEELQTMLQDAVAMFERINHEGETLANVREKSLTLLNSMDTETYKGLETSFTKWLQVMVGNRFPSIELDQDIPVKFKTDDNRPLTFELLSHGTKDVVSLAWRFALTEHFLQEQSGFLILDDPMVDMDPERRKAVVKAIREFSTDTQVLVMTCHPDHAEELVGDEKEVISIETGV